MCRLGSTSAIVTVVPSANIVVVTPLTVRPATMGLDVGKQEAKSKQDKCAHSVRLVGGFIFHDTRRRQEVNVG